MNAASTLGRRAFRLLFRNVNNEMRTRVRMLGLKYYCFPLRVENQKNKLLSRSSSLQARDRMLLRNVKSKISPWDKMYLGEVESYFMTGISMIHCIDEALIKAKKENVQSILDLPCGFGRVLRFLPQRFTDAEITACDIEHKAVDFCKTTFSVKAVYSCKDLTELSLNNKFDLIWCGSLITHLDAEATLGLLNFFHRHLMPEGLLVFSTLGDFAIRQLKRREYTFGLQENDISGLINSYDRCGYGFVNNTNDSSGLGMAITSPAWIREQLGQIGGWHEIYFKEQGWNNHHDVFGMIKHS